MERMVSTTIEIPNSQEMTLFDQSIHGPTPANTNASGINEVTSHPKDVPDLNDRIYLVNPKISANPAPSCT